MKYGKNFKYYREQNGYSQEDLAKKLNISRQAISKWENDWNIPDIGFFFSFWDAFSASLELLFPVMYCGCAYIKKNHLSFWSCAVL